MPGEYALGKIQDSTALKLILARLSVCTGACAVPAKTYLLLVRYLLYLDRRFSFTKFKNNRFPLRIITD